MLEYCLNKISGLRLVVLLRYYTVIISNFFWAATFKKTNEQLLPENEHVLHMVICTVC